METKNRQTLTLEKSQVQKRNSSGLTDLQKSKTKFLLRDLSVFLFLALWVGLCFRYNLFMEEAIVCSIILGIVYFVKSAGNSNNLK